MNRREILVNSTVAVMGGIVGGATGVIMERALREKHLIEVAIATTDTPLQFSILFRNSGGFSEDNIVADLYFFGSDGIRAVVDWRQTNPSVLLDGMTVLENTSREPNPKYTLFTARLSQLNPGDWAMCYITCNSSATGIEVYAQSDDSSARSFWPQASA